MSLKKYVDFSKLTHNTAMLLVVGGVVIVGSIVLAVTHAATPTATISASTGTISGCATKVTDTSTSSGSAVKFSSCSTVSPLGLDASGATVPDSNYAIPAGAIYMATNGNDANAGTATAPVVTLNRAVALVPAGGTIVVRGGTYRDWYNSAGTFSYISKAVTIQAYPHEQVWFDGTNVIPSTSWTSDGAGHWYMAWNTPSFCGNGYYTYNFTAQPTSNSGPCSHYDMYYAAAKDASGNLVTTASADPQMVFINGAQQHEVTTLAGATGGNFYYDWTNKRMYISTNPGGATIEVAARPVAFINTAVGSKVLGIGFKRYASNEYNNNTEGAVVMSGSNSVVENSVFTLNAGGALGISNPTGALVNRSVFASNGFDGLESNGHSHSTGAADNLIIQNSVFNKNNTEAFGYFCSASCSQAGLKLAHMDGYTFKNNILSNNVNAIGFWCDLACTNGVMVNNIAYGNGRGGIMYEVSDTGIIASNLVYNNAQYGIRVAAANTKVYNNTIFNTNGVDLWVYDDPRTPVAGDVGPNTTNVSVVNNIMTLTVQNLIFWASGSSSAQTNPTTPGYFATVNYNSYWRNPATNPIYKWQQNDSTITYYPGASGTVPPGVDANGTFSTATSDPFFTNAAAGDFTVRSDSVAYHSSTALPSDVMKALGLTTSTGYSRGAITWPH